MMRAAKRLNIDHCLDFFSMNLEGAVNIFQINEHTATKKFLDLEAFRLDDLFLLLALFFAFCLAVELDFVPCRLGGGVDLLREDDADFLAVLRAVLLADFRVVFFVGMVASEIILRNRRWFLKRIY